MTIKGGDGEQTNYLFCSKIKGLIFRAMMWLLFQTSTFNALNG